MTSKTVRLGLIGVGRWGRNYIRTIRSFEDIELVAVSSRNPETKTLVPGSSYIVSDWRALLECPAIDGIVIAAPPATHAEILIAAVEAGKSILVEKPLVTSLSDLSAIRTACARTRCTVMVEHTHLFHPAFRALKTAARRYGPAKAIRSSAGAKAPLRHDVSVLWDWAPHDIAMALDFTGMTVNEVRAKRTARQYVGGIASDRLQLQLALANEMMCNITLSTLDDRHRWFAVDFGDCMLVYSDQGTNPLRLYRRPNARFEEDNETILTGHELPLSAALAEFTAAIRDGDPRRDSLALGCEVVEVISRCEEEINRLER
jgi:predicted dehydrogenase